MPVMINMEVKSTGGKMLREKVSRRSQGIYKAQTKRPSPLTIIKATNYDRVRNLIPIRHARMAASPFAFYRGTAAIMARDLASLPHTNLFVQAIGDCHLMNFGGFATPERSLIFDANDFDETLPAPWEWDVKRLATSFVLAARHNNMKGVDAKEMAHEFAFSYRSHLAEYTKMSTLDLWYMKFDLEQVRSMTNNAKIQHLLEAAVAKAEKQTHQQVFYKITQSLLGSFEIAEQKPLIYHPVDVKKEMEMIQIFMDNYKRTLSDDKRYLFNKFTVIDVALKVVGVGSVGTRCLVVLLMNDKEEPLFIQVKEARPSVLEAYTKKSKYKHNGERVVQGQRLVQAASDIFLGWSTASDGRHYYLRQLRDRKIAPDVENFDKELLSAYARLCGRMLARAHAKTGDGKRLSEYMGKSGVLDEALSDFAVAYADQTEKDYEAFTLAIKMGKIPVQQE
ncbi:uncharacterized protein (DUF2252 family) [Chitinophaga skermanii]|uniref:Uncharacterized protein (DUF2252 family) n=1 Tax=Chitinophaga skermanii TaxID=331697 RepID=A0A327R4J1_9BACT|nr:DUF2252 domain-containing protein [Chitinophaga skermanii]RAJ11135.1 uncharacterized protein (DUF2252 family) [Chitinophaga skermanii]